MMSVYLECVCVRSFIKKWAEHLQSDTALVGQWNPGVSYVTCCFISSNLWYAILHSVSYLCTGSNEKCFQETFRAFFAFTCETTLTWAGDSHPRLPVPKKRRMQNIISVARRTKNVRRVMAVFQRATDGTMSHIMEKRPDVC